MRIVSCLIFILLFPLLAFAQDSWIVLEEYDSPGGNAQGLYYAGKYLWHVNGDSLGLSGECMIFKLNPYNMTVIDSIPSPIDAPYGITYGAERWWLTGFGWDTSQLARMERDTFLVDTSFQFPGWYFYGVTCDSTNEHLWISAMDHGLNFYLLEFDAMGDTVVAWHSWQVEWNLGLQYWDRNIWVNTSNWNYPDMTYRFNIDSYSVTDSYVCPEAVPEGIATNGYVWWISNLRYGNHYIWKLVPPGTTYHDIAAFGPVEPLPGEISPVPFAPQFEFINYGSVPESNVPFICRVTEEPGGMQIYYSDFIYSDDILPEERVTIVYDEIWNLQPNSDYKFTFYSDLEIDQVRANDTMRVYVSTGGFHDLALVSILTPDENEPLEPIAATVVVQNLGDYDEPVAPVHLTIEHPNGAISEFDTSVTNLQINEIDTVVFRDFLADTIGLHRFTFDGELPLDYYPNNDVMIRECLIGWVHDVAPLEALQPQPFEPLAAFEPEVVVINQGNYNENFFYVYCTIDDSVTHHYDEHVMCPPLGMGNTASLDFPAFIPPYAAHYTIDFRTALAGDDLPQNDTLRITSSVGIYHDVAPTEIVSPGSIIYPEPFTPQVLVCNLGTFPANNFLVYCQVDSGGTLYYLIQQLVEHLEPLETVPVSFQPVLLQYVESCRFLFTTAWALDDITTNDSLAIWSQMAEGIPASGELTVTEFNVTGGFPNPFNARTSFILELPSASSSRWCLFNIEGREVLTRDLGFLSPGIHHLEIDAGHLTTGLYIARFEIGNYHRLIKILLLK